MDNPLYMSPYAPILPSNAQRPNLSYLLNFPPATCTEGESTNSTIANKTADNTHEDDHGSTIEDLGHEISDKIREEVQKATQEFLDRLKQVSQVRSVSLNTINGTAFRHLADLYVATPRGPSNWNNFCRAKTTQAWECVPEQMCSEKGFGVAWFKAEWAKLSDDQKQEYKTPKVTPGNFKELGISPTEMEKRKRQATLLKQRQLGKCLNIIQEKAYELHAMGLEYIFYIVDPNSRRGHTEAEYHSTRGGRFSRILDSAGMGFPVFQRYVRNGNFAFQHHKNPRVVEAIMAELEPELLNEDTSHRIPSRDALRRRVGNMLRSSLAKATDNAQTKMPPTKLALEEYKKLGVELVTNTSESGLTPEEVVRYGDRSKGTDKTLRNIAHWLEREKIYFVRLNTGRGVD